ncbi:DNA-binding transcriptional regulator [Polaromonas sp. A23]|uniref:XylR family transcriptional regulator n=1 Tax=Polaromonas sp. A23 TaxID=1944133 RepID=UPI0009854679|nr:DNA-binding transcriptional regulator [Polaromonas sp. A23]OOG45155.1 XylR family transcriptional regulator [Polaromonas sp. A23]
MSLHRTPANARVYRVALLFHASKVYDREVIAGIGSYVNQTRVAWDLFLEEDFRFRLDGIEDWGGDGIIADFDDPAVSRALSTMGLPVVAVGSSYSDKTLYPAGVPYVATDNQLLIQQAYLHLIEMGLTQFACYSLPESPLNRWAQEREKVFDALMQRDRLTCHIHRGLATSAPTWNSASHQLMGWLKSLPKPVGIIAVTDARARQLLQACIMADIAVPDEVAIVGIDNDTLGQHLTRIQLSSVSQGTEEMGRAAAHLLHQILGGARLKDTRIVVPPAGVQARASSHREAVHGPHVMRALHYIRQYACQGIKTEQVAAHVGLSRSSLETYFRRELQRTVHDEILLYKLQQARSLLDDSQLTGAEVAGRAGFGSVQYLNSVFKRELGCTPREYRERAATAKN